MTRVYTDEELEFMLERMKTTASAFYREAIDIGVHPWIEFAGILNEYTRAAEEALSKGEDFTCATGHAARSLPMTGYRRAYIFEKLTCAFGPDLLFPTVKEDE